jgi:hypothetical protein
VNPGDTVILKRQKRTVDNGRYVVVPPARETRRRPRARWTPRMVDILEMGAMARAAGLDADAIPIDDFRVGIDGRTLHYRYVLRGEDGKPMLDPNDPHSLARTPWLTARLPRGWTP